MGASHGYRGERAAPIQQNAIELLLIHPPDWNTHPIDVKLHGR